MQILNYFVYLQPFNSREEALAVIAEMSKHEIKQYNLIEDGAYKNAIGLGSFDNIDEARRHAEYVRFLGYDGRYTNEKAHKEVYWINYNVPVGESIPVLQWTKEIAPQSNPQIIPESC